MNSKTVENPSNSLHPKLVNQKYMRQVITNAVIMAGSQAVVAEKVGVSRQYLGDVLHGKREVSANLAEKFGWKRMVVFARVGG